MAEWLRSLTSVLLIIRSSHRCGFAPRTGHEFICETSHVLLAGVSGGFFPGHSGFRPTYGLIRLDMSEKAQKGHKTESKKKKIIIKKLKKKNK